MRPTEIIYQNHHLLIVNKPAGLVIHPTYKNTQGTMWNALLEQIAWQAQDDWQPPDMPDEPEWAGAPSHIQEMLRERRRERLWKEEGLLPKPCLLHRLDKDTSGVVALARTERSRRHIVRQFHEHTIAKRYLAVVRRAAPEWAASRIPLRVTNEQGLSVGMPCDLSLEGGISILVDGPLQRDPADRRRCVVGPDGQEAKTLVKVLVMEGAWFLLEAQPITGRTHQIRAHLAALGYGIVGDRTYAPPVEPGTAEAALSRQFLHAWSLELNRYPDNRRCTFIASLADDLQRWLERYVPSGVGVLNADTVSTE